MKSHSKKFYAVMRVVLFALCGLTLSAGAQTRILRVVTYNIGADINGITLPQPGLIAPPSDTNNFAAGGALAGIGEEILNGNAQPIDILALQETTSNPVTVSPIANGLNTFYGVPRMFTNSTYQATESGGFTSGGNGPNALVYNTRTVQLLASVPVDPPGGTSQLGSASGEYREVMRYQFAPAGVATNNSNTFYVYVSHYKSGVGTANVSARNGEAQIIRNNAATLSPTARILYVGDFNTGVAAEGMYVTLIAPGVNQALDPVNPTGNTNLLWDTNSVLDVKTFSPTGIHYRDDYQMMTTNVYYGAAGGLKLVPGTYHVFGNNGSIGYLGNVTAAGNTAFNNKLGTNGPVFISAAQLFMDLTNASDHLPVVADYTIPLPAPRISSFNFNGNNLTLSVTNGVTNAIYTVLMSTNLAAPVTNWTGVATNIAPAASFTFTATNVVGAVIVPRFFLLKGK